MRIRIEGERKEGRPIRRSAFPGTPSTPLWTGRGTVRNGFFKALSGREGTIRVYSSCTMGVRISSRVPTVEETAKSLGVPLRRVRELVKLVEGKRIATKNESPKRPKSRRGTQRRGKKTEAAR